MAAVSHKLRVEPQTTEQAGSVEIDIYQPTTKEQSRPRTNATVAHDSQSFGFYLKNIRTRKLHTMADPNDMQRMFPQWSTSEITDIWRSSGGCIETAIPKLLSKPVDDATLARFLVSEDNRAPTETAVIRPEAVYSEVSSEPYSSVTAAVPLFENVAPLVARPCPVPCHVRPAEPTCVVHEVPPVKPPSHNSGARRRTGLRAPLLGGD